MNMEIPRDEDLYKKEVANNEEKLRAYRQWEQEHIADMQNARFKEFFDKLPQQVEDAKEGLLREIEGKKLLQSPLLKKRSLESVLHSFKMIIETHFDIVISYAKDKEGLEKMKKDTLAWGEQEIQNAQS